MKTGLENNAKICDCCRSKQMPYTNLTVDFTLHGFEPTMRTEHDASIASLVILIYIFHILEIKYVGLLD